MKTSRCLLIYLMLLSACTPEDIPVTITFDGVAGYVHHASINHVFAHSGNTSLSVSETVPQSIVWTSRCTDLPWKFNNSITLKGWARTGSKNGSAVLFLTFSDSTEKILSADSIKLDRTMLKNDIWTPFQQTFAVDARITAENLLSVSLTNKGSGPVYLDDLIISNH